MLAKLADETRKLLPHAKVGLITFAEPLRAEALDIRLDAHLITVLWTPNKTYVAIVQNDDVLDDTPDYSCDTPDQVLPILKFLLGPAAHVDTSGSDMVVTTKPPRSIRTPAYT